MFPTINLYSSGKFVVKLKSLPYKYWPQALAWGSRTFIREDALTNPRCERDTPPDYHEVVELYIPPQELFDIMHSS